MTETVPSTTNERVQTSNTRPTLSLGNEDSNVAPNLQGSTSITPLTKSVKKIPTFIIWSIFNLLLIPFGIACCYFSYNVNKYKIQNRYAVAKKWSKRTFVLNIITTLLMTGIIVTVVMLHYDYEKRNPGSNANQTESTYIPWQPGR
ncbi:unnamed protein product [Rotaria sp. Silwood1]|nr:unnamed protein product [Rotaria sp. Silwood1]CAF1230336.1 unnamed protein product [Rotaria sp. Silwood1]CAF3491390.1 unnamed protein product [Rotaria sp. Silwood1]CAF3516760.1 unnamed protein product [Rotaria sp. Silwood1]CAF4602890.1 unnamed protein product [Rotaria sp. Silwood1]